MNHTIEAIADGSVTTPRGYKAAGMAAGIKKSGALDLGLLVSQVRCPAAAVFTTNVLKGASLLISQEHLSDGHAQAVIVNSGNANACTGERGLLDAREITRVLSRKLNIPAQDVLPSSTGVIGEYLPLPKLREAIEPLTAQLQDGNGGQLMARAIMTTDTKPKYTARKVTVAGSTFSLGGIAKGAGMIHPNMATMLVFLTTDARLSTKSLQAFLKQAVDQSFNRFTVDGDTSCDDTVLLMANGLASGMEIVPSEGLLSTAFKEALNSLCLDLTYQLARDGEGVSKVVKIVVKGAKSNEDSLKVARCIAVSPLVKTAIHAGDPNWGRIINAAGYSGAFFDPMSTDLWIGDVKIMERGERSSFEESDAVNVMQQNEYEITLDLHQGRGEDFYITTDLSHAYIDINADYRNRT